MTNETTEMWREHREEKAARRRLELQKAEAEMDVTRACAAKGGYEIVVSTDTHWIVKKSGRVVAQYWPSANKWQVSRTSKIVRGTRDKFREHLSRGNF